MTRAQDNEPALEKFSLAEAWDLLQKSLREMLGGFIDHLPNLVFAAIVLLGTWALSAFAQKLYWRIMKKRGLRRSLKDLMIRLVTIAVWIGGLLAASVIVFPSVKPESILAGLGLSSIAIGFAFKDVVENFFAGFLILIREPMEIGDAIECEGVEGRVESITIRDTVIRQMDGQGVLMPNAMLFKNPVRIRTDREERRVSFICGVSYDADLAGAREVIQNAVENAQTVNSDRHVDVFLTSLGASSVDFEVTWWTGSEPREVRRSKDHVIQAVKSALDEAGIEIPFPQRTLHLEGLPSDLQFEHGQG